MYASQPAQRKVIIFQISFIVLLCAGLIGIAFYLGIFKSPSTVHQVTFRAESSSAFGIISWTPGTGQTNSSVTTNTPWETTITFKSGDQVYFSVGNPSQIGSVTCTILIDKKVWKTNSASNPSDKVACAGIIP
jgi:hypothetical protein